MAELNIVISKEPVEGRDANDGLSVFLNEFRNAGDRAAFAFDMFKHVMHNQKVDGRSGITKFLQPHISDLDIRKL